MFSRLLWPLLFHLSVTFVAYENAVNIFCRRCCDICIVLVALTIIYAVTNLQSYLCMRFSHVPDELGIWRKISTDFFAFPVAKLTMPINIIPLRYTYYLYHLWWDTVFIAVCYNGCVHSGKHKASGVCPSVCLSVCLSFPC